MMEKKSADTDLPPGYINLGFDAEPTAGPSAPKINEDFGSFGADGQPIPGPSAPRHEDPEIHLKQPTAPPTGPSTPPPSYEQNPGPPTLKYTLPKLLFEDIYEACILYVKDHCCYSSKFVKEMKLTDINNACAFHYTLESFGEKRETADHFTPYTGGSIDGPSNGPAPNAWDMNVSLPTLFVDSKARMTIPHTEYVKTCEKCSGRGKVTCSSCYGSGTESCSRCSGSGQYEDSRCSSCSGSGRTTCWRCSGSGKVTCSRCDGYGKIKCSKILLLTWTNHLTEYITDIKVLPAKKFKEVTGDTIFLERKDKLKPIVDAPDATVNVASRRLIEAHKNSFRTEFIRKQRHNLKAVPFTIAKYKWKENIEGEFYIYGKEKKVYFDDYPTDCCCCTCC